MKSQITNSSETFGNSSFYRLGGIAAVMMPVIIIIQLITFMSNPPPYGGTALDWFNLFQRNKLIGLINFELLMVLYTLISIPVTLALFIALKRANKPFTSLYLVLSLIGVMTFIAARPVIEMLHLSNGYGAATTDAQRTVFLSAGEAKLAAFDGTAFHVSYVLGSINGLIISLVMLQTNIFSRATACIRIASSICDFGLYIPTIGLYISIFSVLFLFIWNLMIARRLFQLAKGTPEAPAVRIDEAHPVEG